MKTAPCPLVVLFVAFATGLFAQTTPLRIEQTVEPQFPAALSFSPITRGTARIIINVDADGRLVDWLVTGYTNKAFADEAVRALKVWRYTAARENGAPIGIRTELRFEFEAKGRVISLLAIETTDSLYQQVVGQPALITQVCHPRDLDHPIAALDPTGPAHPGQTAETAQPHRVMVDFYIDEQGQPRMPVVVNAAQENFALAAVSALSRWRFTTPTRAGKPVSVRVQQEFIFPGRS